MQYYRSSGLSLQRPGLKVFLALGALAAVLAACGGAGSTEEDVAAESRSEDAAVVPDTGADPFSADMAEAVAEVAMEVPPLDLPAGETEEPDLPWAPEPGEPGYACDSGEDCESGYCVHTPDGMLCTQTCDGECPFDWVCAVYAPSLPDTVFVCVPLLTELCRPCTATVECWGSQADAGQVCVAYGPAGSFCGVPCDTAEDCPKDYACMDVTDVSGAAERQCVRAAGECPCNQWFADAGAHTACYVKNEFGACAGTRACKAGGLSPCDAQTPAAETCNGIDDDCDASVDEDMYAASCMVTNAFGACPGTQQCEEGKLSCVGTEAAPETCDGKDNDCDGVVDDSFPDTDDDGTADCLENDKDGDGIADGLDNCPAAFNPGQQDFDLDTVGDLCDPDDDNDMSSDEKDCAPLDPDIHQEADEVCDGLDNDCNYIVDEGFPDLDADGWKDCFDDDDDGDGSPDAEDCAPADPTISLSANEACDGIDNDCDGSVDEGFPDSDQDGVVDCLDDDKDSDGVIDAADNCPSVVNPLQEDLDKDGLGDACDADADGDAVPDAADNCIGVKNTSQSDIDDDGQGDACDADDDGDGLSDAADNCPLKANPGQEDSDKDGVGNACEDDKDGDGTVDLLDCAPLDPKIFPGAKEVCDGIDNDCDYMVDEGFPDTDSDSLKNCVDDDDDGDSEPDESDCAPLNPLVNSEAAEVCDALDNDCDGLVDEALGVLACGKGVCFHTVEVCVAGNKKTCDPYEGAAPEACDGKDNDCDGMVDEDLGSTTCGIGACFHTQANCKGGVLQACIPTEGATPEACDGLDNDCNAKVDDGLGTLTCGQGICKHSVSVCIGGIPQTCDPMQGAIPEMCDGVDNDCDGVADEDLGQTTCGLGQCAHSVDNCANGKPQVCNPFDGTTMEACDATDNDCDGLIDEDLGTTTCGLGICKNTVPNCVGGQPNPCDPLKGALPEDCDGTDNDCDGLADNGFPDTDTDAKADCVDTDDDGDGILDDLDKCPLVKDPDQKDQDGDGLGDACDPDRDNDGVLNVADNCPDFQNPLQADLDKDGLGDDCDADDDGDGDPDTSDCAPKDPSAGATLPEVCYNGKDDDCDGAADLDAECPKLASCKAVLSQYPTAKSGPYPIDPDGNGGIAAYTAYCDMTTSGGGWTVLYSATGSDGEQPLTSDVEVPGNALDFNNHTNVSRQKKMVLSAAATETLLRRADGAWIKMSHAPFDNNLNSGSSHQHWSVAIVASDGSSAPGWQGYANFNIAGGGDYNVSMTDAGTCNGSTSGGVDHHSGAYYHLNCACQRHYFYSYSSASNDGDAGYDINTGLGAWTATNGCDSNEGGALKFYAASR